MITVDESRKEFFGWMEKNHPHLYARMIEEGTQNFFDLYYNKELGQGDGQTVYESRKKYVEENIEYLTLRFVL